MTFGRPGVGVGEERVPRESRAVYTAAMFYPTRLSAANANRGCLYNVYPDMWMDELYLSHSQRMWGMSRDGHAEVPECRSRIRYTADARSLQSHRYSCRSWSALIGRGKHRSDEEQYYWQVVVFWANRGASSKAASTNLFGTFGFA